MSRKHMMFRGKPVVPVKGYSAENIGCVPTFTTKEKFIEAKLKIFVKDFKITPTDAEINHLLELETESQINAACLSIIDRHWR